MVDPQNRLKFPDPKPTVGRAEAERQLLAHLGYAMKLISEGGPKTREGIMEAIEAVICFLNDRGVSSQQIWPFGYLRQELALIFAGKRSLILQPGVKTRDDLSGTLNSGPGKHEIMNFAAACSEAIYRLGKSDRDDFPKRTRKEADAYVASAVAKWPAFDNGQPKSRTIKLWRDEIAKAERDRFDLLVRQFTKDDVGRRHLVQVLKGGPPHIGGFQNAPR